MRCACTTNMQLVPQRVRHRHESDLTSTEISVPSYTIIYPQHLLTAKADCNQMSIHVSVSVCHSFCSAAPTTWHSFLPVDPNIRRGDSQNDDGSWWSSDCLVKPQVERATERLVCDLHKSPMQIDGGTHQICPIGRHIRLQNV